jgi:hypothetical protein
MPDFNLLNSLPLEALPIEKNFKLKVYAMLSTHKSIPEDMIREHMLMTLAVAYDRPTAELAVLQGMQSAGISPADYNLTRLLIERNLMDLVDFRSVSRLILTEKRKEKIAVDWISENLPPLESDREFKITKGKQEMIAYVRYIFGKAGTPEEKVVCENVVAKYEKIKNA